MSDDASRSEAHAESPHSLRRLLLRIGGTLVGLLVLYMLSAGPVSYYVERRPPPQTMQSVLYRLYAPLGWVAGPGGEYFLAYVDWWVNLARRPERND